MSDDLGSPVEYIEHLKRLNRELRSTIFRLVQEKQQLEVVLAKCSADVLMRNQTRPGISDVD